MKIEMDKVTRTSQIVAIILFVGVFVLGFFLGALYQLKSFENALKAGVGSEAVDVETNNLIDQPE